MFWNVTNESLQKPIFYLRNESEELRNNYSNNSQRLTDNRTGLSEEQYRSVDNRHIHKYVQLKFYFIFAITQRKKTKLDF